MIGTVIIMIVSVFTVIMIIMIVSDFIVHMIVIIMVVFVIMVIVFEIIMIIFVIIIIARNHYECLFHQRLAKNATTQNVSKPGIHSLLLSFTTLHR